MQTKETMAKSSWKTLIPTMKQVKESAIIALFFLKSIVFLTPKKIRSFKKNI
jgi:hypothetical protein